MVKTDNTNDCETGLSAERAIRFQKGIYFPFANTNIKHLR